MKRGLFCLILIFLCSICFGCKYDPSISFLHGNISINIDTNYTVDNDDVIIRNSKSDFEIIVLNKDIAEVQGKKIIPKSKGVTILRFQLKDNNSIKCDVELIVTNIIYAKNATIENDYIQINLRESTEEYNPITLNDNCNEVPNVVFNNEIIDYNYQTGKITAKSVGNTTVQVLFKGCNVSFDVRVVDTVYASYMNVKDVIVFTGTEGKFNFEIVPYYANMYSFFGDSDLIDVEKNGNFFAKETGNCVIYYEYYKDENTSKLETFNVKIIDKIEKFDFTIVDKDTENSIDKLFVNRQYRIRFPSIDWIEKEDISISDNISFSAIQSDKKGLYLDFYFKNTGENIICINVNVSGYLFSETQEVVVYDYSDLKLYSKIAFVPQSNDKNEFELSLSGVNNSLVFMLMLKGEEIDESFNVYLIEGNEKIKVSNVFVPELVGEYRFLIVINDCDITSAIVNVQE